MKPITVDCTFCAGTDRNKSTGWPCPHCINGKLIMKTEKQLTQYYVVRKNITKEWWVAQQ